jgi:hypothetical protein
VVADAAVADAVVADAVVAGWLVVGLGAEVPTVVGASPDSGTGASAGAVPASPGAGGVAGVGGVGGLSLVFGDFVLFRAILRRLLGRH